MTYFWPQVLTQLPLSARSTCVRVFILYSLLFNYYIYNYTTLTHKREAIILLACSHYILRSVLLPCCRVVFLLSFVLRLPFSGCHTHSQLTTHNSTINRYYLTVITTQHDATLHYNGLPCCLLLHYLDSGYLLFKTLNRPFYTVSRYLFVF